MALASTDPRVLMGQAKCFACLTPHQQYILRTYLLALIAMGDTSITGVQALSAASTCFACLTYEELLAAKQYLMAVWLGLDTTKAGIIAQAASAACDFACLTPKQAEQLRTYLLAVTAGVSTTAAGVRTLEAAAKCFNCLESKQQLEAQVYLLSILAPGAPTTPAAIMQGAKCYLACVPPELHEALQTSLFAQVTSRSTPPCVTPSAPSSVQATTARVADPTTQLLVRWLQPANSGTLVTGYTVFWGTTAGGPYTNNSGLIAGGTKQYTITGLTAGTTYYIVVQADTSISGCVSANSAETNATTSGASPVDPAVTAWQARVIANGGASPSQATLNAADTFWKGVKADGIDGLIIALNFMAPDNLIAAITPFIKGPGNDPWTNHNFIAGDLSTAGLTGDINTRFLDTGINLSTAFANDNSAGFTWYARCALNTNFMRMNAFNGANMGGLYSDGGSFYVGAYTAWDVSQTQVAGSGFASDQYMYISGNRTAANAVAIHGGNGSNAFHTLVSGAGAAVARPNLVLYAYCWNTNGVAGQFPNVAPICSFICIHLGLTLAQAQALFNRVQTLRQAFTGGYT